MQQQISGTLISVPLFCERKGFDGNLWCLDRSFTLVWKTFPTKKTSRGLFWLDWNQDWMLTPANKILSTPPLQKVLTTSEYLPNSQCWGRVLKHQYCFKKASLPGIQTHQAAVQLTNFLTTPRYFLDELICNEKIQLAVERQLVTNYAIFI